MATIFKRGKTWWANFVDADGNRQRVSTGLVKKRDAEKAATDLEAASRKTDRQKGELATAYQRILAEVTRDASEGKLTLARATEYITRIHQTANPDFRVVSLTDHLNEWVREQESSVKGSTAGVYRDAFRRFTEAIGKRKASSPIGDLTEKDVLSAREKIKASGKVKCSTINLDLRCLRRALSKAVGRGLASSNPAEGIRPLPEQDSTIRAPFTIEEVRALIKTTDQTPFPDEWAGAITIAVFTGLRMSDVLSLTRDHIDGTSIVIKPRKTDRKKKTIVVPLTPPCLAWIGDREGAFFPKLSKIKTGTSSTAFLSIMKKAGVPREITMKGGEIGRRSFHSLRHTFTSLLAELDIHSDVRQKLTGHSSAGIHARYTHLDESLVRAVGKLPSIEV